MRSLACIVAALALAACGGTKPSGTGGRTTEVSVEHATFAVTEGEHTNVNVSWTVTYPPDNGTLVCTVHQETGLPGYTTTRRSFESPPVQMPSRVGQLAVHLEYDTVKKERLSETASGALTGDYKLDCTVKDAAGNAVTSSSVTFTLPGADGWEECTIKLHGVAAAADQCTKPQPAAETWTLARVDTYDGSGNTSGSAWPRNYVRQGDTTVRVTANVTGRGTFTNTGTWTAPPAKLTKGQTFTLSMSVGAVDDCFLWQPTGQLGTAAPLSLDYLFDEFPGTVATGAFTGVGTGDSGCIKGSCGGIAVLKSTTFTVTFDGCSDDAHCALVVRGFTWPEGPDSYLRVYYRYTKQ